MDWNEYALLRDNINDFKRAAILMESEITRLGVDDSSTDKVSGTGGRRHHDVWVSMKAVSHFNLGISLELMLKLILRLNGAQVPKIHQLAELYDTVPGEFRRKLEHVYASPNASKGRTYSLVAFIHSETTPREKPSNRPLSSLRDFLVYLDEDVMLWQKRYSWEQMDRRRWRHYLSDISEFTDFVDRVMADMPKTPRSQG